MSDARAKIVVDDSELQAKSKEAKAIAAQTATAFRRSLQFGVLTLQAVGVVIDEQFRLAIEAAALIAESALTIASVGLTPGAVLRIGQVAVIMLQINALNNARLETAAQLGALEQGLDLVNW